jgi:Holliday junction DNA helicase RuvA
MYEYLKGKLIEKTPSNIIIECSGVGYFLNISLQTFSQIKDIENIKLFTHQVVKEDSHTLFGFISKGERTIFRQLISVSGVGANTARVILSSMSTDEVFEAIIMNNVAALKAVKGIGAKTAQRIILDLKDKIKKDENSTEKFDGSHNTTKEEALSALVMLGFARQSADKAIQKVFESQGFSISVEELVRYSLKIL